MAQALDIWSDLCDALAGCNGFGGDTAELYLYGFMRRCPSAEMTLTGPPPRQGSQFDEAVKEQVRDANESLFAILAHFAKERSAAIAVNGKRLGPWVKTAGFDHRVHVKVTQRERRTG